jgi:hypothetical protein
MIGFFHAMLDSLGWSRRCQDRWWTNSRCADLAIPSPARLRDAICGPRSARRIPGAVVAGVVRHARTAGQPPEST